MKNWSMKIFPYPRDTAALKYLSIYLRMTGNGKEISDNYLIKISIALGRM